MKYNQVFDPHQLDSEWRFQSETISDFISLTSQREEVLLLGCPSIASGFHSRTNRIVLIERNPNHFDRCPSLNIQADLRYYSIRYWQRNRFDLVVMDPPWYPSDFNRWLKLAISSLKVGGRLVFTLWPTQVRFSALAEHSAIFKLIENSGELLKLPDIKYIPSKFETWSLKDSDYSRDGLVYQFVKKRHFEIASKPIHRSGQIWHRFVVEGRQLAICASESDLSERARKSRSSAFLTEPFTLKNTSRRNSELKDINLWTSENQVAQISNPITLIKDLKRLGARKNAKHKSSIELVAAVDFSSALEGSNANWGQSWKHHA